MRKVSLGCAFVAFGLSVVTSASAAAPNVTKIGVRGQSAFAVAEHHDDCIDASFSISASDETTRDGSGSTTQRAAFVGFGGRDLCNFLSFGGGTSLTLTTTLNNDSVTLPFDFLVDYANTETDERTQRRIVGTVKIVANGDFEKVRETIIMLNDGIKTTTKLRGNTREADAIVTATLDGIPFTFDTGTGSLGTIKNGIVEITR
jgi:hypothetical protein